MRMPELHALDLRSCAWFNRAGARDPVRRLFAGVSRLGDGVVWYALMLALPLQYGYAGLQTSLYMALAGLAGLFVYRRIKARTRRLRPFMAEPGITAWARTLDKYSFPSGHTLQAVGFTTVVTAFHPELGWILWPFAALVALSRPVLGLHYPSDVLVGAVIGASVGWTTVQAAFVMHL